MAKFLTTRGLSHGIEEIIDQAKKNIFLLSPYLKFSSTLYERLRHVKKGVAINLIYGKEELNKREGNLLKELNCKIYFKHNLHAKCYANEKSAIICSMNLYEYSEVNNEEMGLLIESSNDKQAYLDCFKTINIIRDSSISITLYSSDNIKKATDNSEKEYRVLWLNWLKNTFPNALFKEEGWKVWAENLPKNGVKYSNSYGFASIFINN